MKDTFARIMEKKYEQNNQPQIGGICDIMKKIFTLLLAVMISVIMSLLMCSCSNSANDDEEREMMQSITVVSEEYVEGYPQKETFTLSGEDSDKLLEILSLDSLIYSEDVLKIEPEKSYTIIIGENERLSINREKNDESLVYMIRSYNGRISGTYISSMTLDSIDEILSM